MSQSFLYPFLAKDKAAIDAPLQISELISSARRMWEECDDKEAETLLANDTRLHAASSLIARAAENRAHVLVIGNGGSASDAERLVRLLPRPVNARALLDPVVLTALANDVGATRMFDRQIETFARESDVVIAFSTSGTSSNVLAGLARAHQQGAHTIAFAGYDGASLKDSADVDVCLSVASTSVHRIQESQGALATELAERVHALLRQGANERVALNEESSA